MQTSARTVRPRRLVAPVVWLAVWLAACTADTGLAASTPAAATGQLAERTYPSATPPAGMTLSALLTATMESRAAFAYSGGAFGDRRLFAQGAILVRHPQGDLLFDAGFGTHVDQHFQTIPWLMQQLTSYTKGTPARTQLQRAGIEPRTLKAVVLTHAHWDHVSGLEDLPGVPVWLPRAELNFVNSGGDATVLARQLGVKDYQTYEFGEGPYLGFAHSRDVFGDGSVVLVQAPGHTPGSILAFIATPDGKHYLLVGDLAWQAEGIDLPAPKPWPVRNRVDANPDETFAMVQRVHTLEQQLPGLIVVPAHDYRVWQTLPTLPSR